MNNSIDELKTLYDDIPMPGNLKAIVTNSIKRGKVAMTNRRRKIGYVKALGSIAAAFVVFATAINTSPAFADTVNQLPGGQTIVRMLTFFGDTAQGGEVTDGQDIRTIKVAKSARQPDAGSSVKYHETLTVDLYLGTDAAAVAGHFTVTQRTHPYSIEVHVAGVRTFSAANDFPDLSKMHLVQGIYRLVTLDDSAHRFVVTFSKPVVIEVSEQQNPARLIVKVREAKQANAPAPMYSVRTASLPFGESIGVAENMLRFELASEDARLLRDESGLYLAEEGLYATLGEAEARVAAVKQSASFPYELHIEERTSGATPRTIRP